MNAMDNLIIVGRNENSINIVRAFLGIDNNIIVEKIYEINNDQKHMIHSALYQDNTLYLLDSYNNMIIQLKINTNQYNECTTGRDPRHLCEHQNNFYVTNFESDSISIVDSESNILTGTIKSGIKPHGILQLDNKLYIACYEENIILEYSLDNSEKVYHRLTGKPMHLLNDNNNIFIQAYIIEDNICTEINILDTTNSTIKKAIQIMELTNNIAYDSENKMLYLLGIEKANLYVVNLFENKIKKQIHLGGYLEDISVGKTNIYVANSRKKHITVLDRITQNQLYNIYFDFCPEFIIIA